MEVSTRKVFNSKGEVEAVQVPIDYWHQIVKALNIHENQESISDTMKVKLQREYEFVNQTFTLPADQLIAMKKLSIDPEYVGGAACFYEAPRLPVKILVDYLESGDTVEDFLDDYDTVSRATVEFFAKHLR